MKKKTIATVWKGVSIFTDGDIYYIDDGFGDFYYFTNLDDAIAHIEGGYEE